MYVLYQEKVRERMRVSVYSIQGVMEAPAAIYILSAISTSDMFSTSSVKACTSSNDIPSCTMKALKCKTLGGIHMQSTAAMELYAHT